MLTCNSDFPNPKNLDEWHCFIYLQIASVSDLRQQLYYSLCFCTDCPQIILSGKLHGAGVRAAGGRGGWWFRAVGSSDLWTAAWTRDTARLLTSLMVSEPARAEGEFVLQIPLGLC